MSRVTLTAGNWAEIADVDEITEGEFADMRANLLLRWEELTDDEMTSEKEFNRTRLYGYRRIGLLVKSWNLPHPLPSDDESSLEKIKHKDFIQLVKAANEAEERLVEEPGTDPLGDKRNGSRSKPSATRSLAAT